MRALVIQHDHGAPAGTVGERLADRGFEVVEQLVVPEDRYHSPDVQTEFPEPEAYDLIVPLGAPWSADEFDTIGCWLKPELDLLRRAHQADVPVLGICFGGQALACALGGAVRRAERVEFGWAAIETDEPDLVEQGPWFEAHYDRWLLPPGAVEIARTPIASQAFTIGRSLGLQFHPEITTPILQTWLSLGDDRMARAAGVDPDEVVAQTRGLSDVSRLRAHRLVDRFLDRFVLHRRRVGR